jgi:Raf kinase inhibitor-like YbhB/YbcL family protein
MYSKNLFILFLIILLYSCQNRNQEIKNKEEVTKEERRITEMKITSSAFKEGELIPSEYTCDGQNISPGILWNAVPDGIKSFAIICDDPDAPSGDWVHWVIYNIPAVANGLKENYPRENKSADGTRQGITDFRKTGYDGPCPPAGTHRYIFNLYALDISIGKDDLTKSGLMNELNGHIIAQAQLTGKYKRQ